MKITVFTAREKSIYCFLICYHEGSLPIINVNNILYPHNDLIADIVNVISKGCNACCSVVPALNITNKYVILKSETLNEWRLVRCYSTFTECIYFKDGYNQSFYDKWVKSPDVHFLDICIINISTLFPRVREYTMSRETTQKIEYDSFFLTVGGEFN
jgi:hypothetical protein